MYLAHHEPKCVIIISSSIIVTIIVTIITVTIIMHLQEGQQGEYGVPKIAAMTHKATIKLHKLISGT